MNVTCTGVLTRAAAAQIIQGRHDPYSGGMSRGTHKEVRDGLGDPQGGLGWVGGTSGRSRMGRGTHEKVRDGSEEPQ